MGKLIILLDLPMDDTFITIKKNNYAIKTITIRHINTLW